MTATPSSNCPDCGAPLTSDSPQALCPACLMRQALASRTILDGAAPAAPAWSPEEIADRFPGFEILECLGRGGMGVVYKARQKSLNRLVAIKILAPERVSESRFAERFAREAELLAKLNHPHIVTIHDFGETGDLFYLVMEFVDGVNLRDLLRDGKLEPKQALAIVPPICEALQFAHDKGIVHRDIKPENLLLDRDGRIKIADFGIAALMGADGDAAGTPAYMAPEQSGASSGVDSRADIYALGVVLYEMLTGERPEKDLVAPSKKVLLDVRIDEMVLRALEMEPERRYQTAGEFRTVVETMAGTRDLPGSKPAADAGSSSWGKWVAALLTVASLLAGLSAVLHLQKDQAEPASGEVNASKRTIEPPPGATGSKTPSDPLPGSPEKSVRLTPEQLRELPTDQVIQEGLLTPRGSWYEWQEMRERAEKGKVSVADGDRLFDGVIEWLRREHPDGYPDKDPLGFLQIPLDDLSRQHLVSEQRLLDFLQVFYGKPFIVPLHRLRQGGTVRMDITLHQEFYRELLGHKLLNEVRSITVDGRPVPVQQLFGSSGHSANRENHNVELQVSGLAPGRHVVKVEMDSALVTVAESAELDQQAPPEMWPPTKRRWQRTCEAELWVYAKDAEIVGLSDDPALNPVNSRGLTVKPIIIRMRDGKRVAAVTFDHKSKTKIPYSVSVTLKLDGKSYPCGRFCSDGNGYSDSSGNSDSTFIAELGDLDPQISDAEVVLAPDPRFIEPSPRVDKIWGKDIVLSGIPLKRLDAAQPPPAPDAETGKRPIFTSDLEKMSNDHVIRVGIENPGESSPWDVLIERMNNGQFGATEADALVEALTEWLRKDHPNGYGEQRISLMKLIKELHQRHLVIERRTMDYLQALNGNGGVGTLPRVREGATVQLHCDTGTPFIWNDEWLGLALLREVESITLDGQPVELRGITKSLFNPPQFDGELTVGDLAPGKHVVRCEIFSALVPVADVAGLGRRAPRGEWPAIKHSWKASFDVDLDVFPKDATLVSLSDDPALDPLESGALKAKSIVIERRNKSWVSVVAFEDDPARGIPFSVAVTLKLAGKTYDCGYYCSSGHGAKAYYLYKNDGHPFVVDIEQLDPQVTEAELLLTPAPEKLESYHQVDRIWGKDIVIGHVPLKRSDPVESK